MKKLNDTIHEWLWDRKYDALALMYSMCPIQKNKVVIVSYYGADYGDNGKYIVAQLRKRKADLDIVWLLKRELMENHNLPEGVRAVEYRSRESVYELQTAAVWIDNARKVYGLKRKGQLYIQTWHGGPGVKRIEKDVEAELEKRYVQKAKLDSKMCDIILSNSDFMTDLYSRIFWYDGRIVECGTPRNDVLCGEHPELREKIRAFYGVAPEKKILLYAPTFRKDKRLDVYDIDLKNCAKTLSEKFGGEYAVYLRLHPNISHLADQMDADGKTVINATLYPDMQELLSGSDCLITDYSSCSIDFSLTGRPCFLYASDIEAYRQNRGYYFGFDELPYDIAQNNRELNDNIQAFDEVVSAKRVAQFHAKTGMFDKGTACETCANMILRHCQGLPWETEKETTGHE